MGSERLVVLCRGLLVRRSDRAAHFGKLKPRRMAESLFALDDKNGWTFPGRRNRSPRSVCPGLSCKVRSRDDNDDCSNDDGAQANHDSCARWSLNRAKTIKANVSEIIAEEIMPPPCHARRGGSGSLGSVNSRISGACDIFGRADFC